MAITYISSTTGANTSGLVASSALPSSIRSGDILLATVHLNGGSGDTPPQIAMDMNGNTPFIDSGLGVRRYNSDSGTYYIYYKIVGKEEPSTYRWSLSQDNRWGVTIASYRGVNTSNIFDVFPTSSSENTGSDATALTKSITTISDNAMVIAVGFNDSSSITFSSTPADSFNSRQNNSGEQLIALADKLIVTKTTQSAVSWGASGANGWATNIFALRAEIVSPFPSHLRA